MYCEECGAKIPDDSRYCEVCGAAVRSLSSPSDQANVDGAKYESAEQRGYSDPRQYGGRDNRPGYDPYINGDPYENRAPVPGGGMLPEPEKKHTGMTVLIVVLSIVAVLLVGTLVVLGIRTFGGGSGSGDPAAELPSGGEQTESSRTEETQEESETDETGESFSIAPSVTEEELPTTAGQTETETTAPQTAAQGDYILPDSASSYLTEADLAGLTKEELRLARNEIYARHGRIFKDADLNAYFMSKSWYTPLYEPEQFDEDAMFNEYEKANRQLISDYEEKMGY